MKGHDYVNKFTWEVRFFLRQIQKMGIEIILDADVIIAFDNFDLLFDGLCLTR